MPAPHDVTYCELAANPRQNDNSRVRITAFVSLEFEHFGLSDPGCTPPKDSDFSVWVAFGGEVRSGAVYCCPGEGGAPSTTKPDKSARFPLVADGTFRRFKQTLDTERDTVIRGTFVGTLLVKPQSGGYGHMGCCSLFVIEHVEQFDHHDRRDLDYRSSLGSGEARGCWGRLGDANYFATYAELMRQQQEADAGERPWAFDSPERVALEGARAKLGPLVSGLVAMKTARDRQVFEWRHGRAWTTVVVSRQSWLSYFAKSKVVAWAVISIDTDSCGIEINPRGDIRAQVLAAFEERIGSPIVHPRLPSDWLAGRGGRDNPGPDHATFFDVAESHAIAVSLDGDGWPSWVDIRPKDRYGVPADVWDLPDILRRVPLAGRYFEEIVVLLDAVRPMGAPRGPVRQARGLRTQEYEHATLVWEDASEDKNGGRRAVRAFSVRWTRKQ